MGNRRVEAMMDYSGIHTQRSLGIVADINDDDQTVMIRLEQLDTTLLERFIVDVLAPSHHVFVYADENSISNPILEAPNRYSLTIEIAGLSYIAYVCKLFKNGWRRPGTTFVLRPKAREGNRVY